MTLEVFLAKKDVFLYNAMEMMLGAKDAIRIVPYFVLPQFYPILFLYETEREPIILWKSFVLMEIS